MQNAHCGGQVIDKIYFLVSYMPIWSFWSELVQLEPYMVCRSDSNEHIDKKPEVCHLSPPFQDESKSPKTVTSGPIYGYNMASSSSN